MDKRSLAARLGLEDTFADPKKPPKAAADATGNIKPSGPAARIAPHTIEAAKRDSIASLQENSPKIPGVTGLDGFYNDVNAADNRDRADRERQKGYNAQDLSDATAAKLGMQPKPKTAQSSEDSQKVQPRRRTSLDDEVDALMSGRQTPQ